MHAPSVSSGNDRAELPAGFAAHPCREKRVDWCGVCGGLGAPGRGRIQGKNSETWKEKETRDTKTETARNGKTIEGERMRGRERVWVRVVRS